MTYQDFLTALKKQTDTRLFLICGENEYFKRESLKAVFAHFNAKPEDLDVDHFDAKAKEADIVLACQTLPFMAEKRLVVAEDFSPLVSAKQGGEDVLDSMTRFGGSTVLIFYCAQKPDKRKKLYKTIAEKGMVIEFGQPALQDIIAWVSYAFANLGKTIDRPAVNALIERSGQDMVGLSGEIEKIVSYVQDDKVKTSDVVKIASQSLEYNVFKIHDLLMKKDAADALHLLNDVLETEKSPFGVMGLIAGKFRAMYKARTLMDAKYPQDKAIQLIGGHPFAAKMALQDARSFSAEDLMAGINTLARIDYLYKTGQMDSDISFAKTLMEIYRV